MYNPFILITLSLICGILYSYYSAITFVTITVLLSLSILYYLYNLKNDRRNTLTLIVIFFLLGMTLLRFNDRSVLINEDGKRVELSGTIEEVIKYNLDEGKYILKVNKLNGEIIQAEKILLKIIGNRNIELGDKITLNGIIKVPNRNSNPKLFNYRLYLKTEKIFTNITINDYGVTYIDKHDKEFKYKIKDRFISDVQNLYTSTLNPINSSLMTSIVLGDSSYLDEDNRDKYRDMGLAHILAVSGLHIGLISGALIFFFSRIGIKRRTNILITLSIIWIYGYFIGYPPSILRSSIMFTILFYSQLIHEPYESLNSIFLAMFILLIINPFWIFSLGFQLSFAATISIVILSKRIVYLFYPFNNKIIYSISSILAVQIGLYPIQAYYFNRINIIGIFANLLVVPLISISLILGIIMIPIYYIMPILNILIGNILNLLLSLKFNIIELLSYIPFSTLKIYSPDIFSIIIYYLIIFYILKSYSLKNMDKPIKRVVLISLCYIFIVNSMIVINDKSIELHFIDVGQGDSILIRTKEADYLMDTGGSLFGNYDPGESITLPYLEKLGIRRLKAVFITHFHEDHAKGISPLLKNLKIDSVYASYIPENNEIYNDIKSNNLDIKIVKEKDKFFLCKNTGMLMIWPPRNPTVSYSENNMSLCSILSYYDYRVLFTGDIEKEAEVLIGENINTNIDIIKVPHHGSKTSSTESFLDKINPNLAVISLGKNNMYGHPSKEVIGSYEKLGTHIYRTDNMGRIIIKLQPKDLNISRYLQDEVVEKFLLKDIINNNLLFLCFNMIYYVLSYIMVKVYISRRRNFLEL